MIRRLFVPLPFVCISLAAAAEEHSEKSGGVELPLDFRLNGTFDLAYERVGYRDNLWDGKNDLRNYHHFLFLTRRAPTDDVVLNIEAVDLSFYEVGYWLKLDKVVKDLDGVVKFGKVLVPFGPEPLFHKSYGGRSGFDQQVLPTVWAQNGATLQLLYRVAGIHLTSDFFGVHGYRLRASDGVLNLQADFSPNDNLRFGYGGRLGGAWGPITVWYSAYTNKLGYFRRLFMQALDVSVWRLRGIPIAEDLALTFGVMRADVSGGDEQGFGGPSQDYYHFADYVQLRYYPLEWLYVQARTGIRTTDNRRRLYYDKSRQDELDSESHNVGVVAMLDGFRIGLFHYWNLERADEVDDDFLRLAVTYAF